MGVGISTGGRGSELVSPDKGGGVTRAKGATHLLAPGRSDCPFRRSALRAHRESDHGKLPQTAYPATSDTNVPLLPPQGARQNPRRDPERWMLPAGPLSGRREWRSCAASPSGCSSPAARLRHLGLFMAWWSARALLRGEGSLGIRSRGCTLRTSDSTPV